MPLTKELEAEVGEIQTTVAEHGTAIAGIVRTLGAMERSAEANQSENRKTLIELRDAIHRKGVPSGGTVIATLAFFLSVVLAAAAFVNSVVSRTRDDVRDLEARQTKAGDHAETRHDKMAETLDAIMRSEVRLNATLEERTNHNRELTDEARRRIDKVEDWVRTMVPERFTKADAAREADQINARLHDIESKIWGASTSQTGLTPR